MHRPSTSGAAYLQRGDARRNGKKKAADPYRVCTPQCTPHERPPQAYHMSAGAPTSAWPRARPLSHSPYIAGTSCSDRRPQPKAHALTGSSYEPSWAELSERYSCGGASASVQSSRAAPRVASPEDLGGWMRMRYERYTVAALNYNYHRLPGEPFDETYDGKLGSVYTFVTEARLHSIA